MSGKEDTGAVTTTIDAGGTLSGTDSYLEVDTVYADEFHTFVDDGSGGAPATYDITIEVYSHAAGDWVPYAKRTGSTEFSFHDDAVPGKMRIDITNQSGASATYRIVGISTTTGRR